MDVYHDCRSVGAVLASVRNREVNGLLAIVVYLR